MRTFGRIGGRALSPRQQNLVETLLPTLAVPDAEAGALAPVTLFGFEPDEVWLEIGFGGGEHLTGQAVRHPNIGLIGCEPFIEGMAKALGQIEDQGLSIAKSRFLHISLQLVLSKQTGLKTATPCPSLSS